MKVSHELGLPVATLLDTKGKISDFTAGVPLGVSGKTNMIHVVEVS